MGVRFFLCSSSCLLKVWERGIPTHPLRDRRRPKTGREGVRGGVSFLEGSGHAVGSSFLSRHLLGLSQSLSRRFCSVFSSWRSLSKSNDSGVGGSAIDTAIGIPRTRKG